MSESPRQPRQGRSLIETLRWMHHTGPTRRWARWYRHHWRRLRAARRARWDRPPEPHDWRWGVGLLGRGLIVTGLLMLGFVGYQLWGTGIETARAQRDLAAQFDDVLTGRAPVVSSTVPTTTPSTVPAAAEPTAPTTAPATVPTTVPTTATEPIRLGDPLARIEMPAIGTDHIVVAGVGVPELQLGPGHFPDTPLPGQLGNAAIAGHRTTYGQPFHDVDRLVAGDDIVVTTAAGTFVYEVTDTLVVDPSAYHVVSTTDPTKAMLTLTSCHPKWSAAQRIIVHAELDPTRSDPVSTPTSYVDLITGSPVGLPSEDTPDTSSPVTTTDSGATSTTAVPAVTPAATPTTTPTAAPDDPTGISDAFSAGWFHDRGALPHVLGWGALLIALWIGARLLARRRRSLLIGWGPAILPFVVALYFFYENVNRLLPPNL